MCQLQSPGIGTRMVQTPANITLPKSKHNVAVSCTAQCYSPGVSTLASHTEVMTAGNVLFGGIIGLGVDAASGAMNTYDPGVEVLMTLAPAAMFSHLRQTSVFRRGALRSPGDRIKPGAESVSRRAVAINPKLKGQP